MSDTLVTLDGSGQSENKSQTDESRMTMDLAVLMAAHNRRDTTLLCLRSLFEGRLDNVHLSVTLVDDGSNDGTADAIRLQFPSVAIIHGDGTLFWSRAMALAWPPTHTEPGVNSRDSLSVRHHQWRSEVGR